MPAPAIIRDLVQKFETNLAQYKSASYNEMETRVEFINPFWEALGWDVNNTQGYALNYRDVVHEDSIYLKGVGNSNSKAPDYAFRIGGVRKFFLEAKKPSVPIKTDASAAFQLRCYGWSCGLSLSVLSDFEELAVYDCRIRPKNTDPASTARIKYFTFREYVDRWDEIEEIFHRENILRGNFDRFIGSKKSKAGTSEVDEEFLREIEEWRLILARDVAKNNPELDARALNFVVQRTIDRIVFLRMAEDRGIEPEDQLFDLMNTKEPGIYVRLMDVCRAADEKYNSGFFHFTSEADQTEEPDVLTPGLKVSDHVLTEILSRVYAPVSPYRFDVLPVEILGSVYERFLGKVIRLTPARLVKVEEKPEVKKANGVFYTPPYIVNYIVRHMVGRLCEGKTPREVAKLKILDPACGSGSFLLGAYKFLMDWHLKYWLEEKEKTGKIPRIPTQSGKHKKSDPNTLCQSVTGEWRLTLAERKRILLNNIFGVDLDAQAVEVTKLSLSLCVLEGFNDETLQANLRLFYDRALPNLSENIRCGNSLIGPDFYEQSQGTIFDLEEQLTINAFDWRDPVYGFGEILKEGGFDAVMGNPPYGSAFRNDEKIYLSNTHNTVPDFAIADFFIEVAHDLLRNDGLLSFIIPNTFMMNVFAKNYRQSLLNSWSFERIDNLSEFEVFKTAKVRNCIISFQKNRNDFTAIFANPDFVDENLVTGIEKQFTRQELYEHIDNWLSLITQDSVQRILIEKIKATSQPLSTFAEISQGLIPYDKYRGHSKKTIKNRIWHSDHQKDETFRKELAGKDVNRYKLQWNGKTWISYGEWLAAPRRKEFFTFPRIIIREITSPQILATYTEEEYYNTPSIINCINFTINIYYALGIINSKLMTFYHKSTSPKSSKGLFPKILVNDVRHLPIHPIDFTNPTEKAQHDRIVRAVTELLELNHRLQTETFLNPQEKTILERRASSLDRQIDELVFDLYGLTPEERALCE